MTTLEDYIATLPEEPGPKREDALREAATGDMSAPMTWATIETEANGHSAALCVMADALKVGESSDNFRITVTQVTAQKIADHFDSVLPTAKISDLVREHATVTLKALTAAKWVDDGTMSLTSRMVEYSRLVDEQRAGQCGLIDTVGKDWVNTNKLTARPDREANYGWHSAGAIYQAATPAGGKVWQPVSLAHDLAHVDYSQSVRLIKRRMIVDGVEMDIEEVARDPELCWLVSSEGVMQSLRHPAVARPGEEPAEEDVPVTTRYVPLFDRTLRRGMVGTDVAALQGIVLAKQDGVFGPKTEVSVKTWQGDNGLLADGIFGPKSRAKAIKTLSAPSDLETVAAFELPVDPLEIETVLAANYTNVKRDTVKWIVMHSMEAAEKPSTAEAVANWFAGKSGDPPRASAHYNIDCDSIVRSVPEHAVAWQAPGANRYGIGLEHAGYARQSKAEWLDEYSESMLSLSARLAAGITERWSVPVRYVDEKGLLRGESGITTHQDVTQAFKKGSHWDPGNHFPMDWYIERVKAAR